jgi:hypothetical protein
MKIANFHLILRLPAAHPFWNAICAALPIINTGISPDDFCRLVPGN